MEHLSRSHRVNGLRFLFFLTDFGARAFARDAVHAVEGREPTINTEVRVSLLALTKPEGHGLILVVFTRDKKPNETF